MARQLAPKNQRSASTRGPGVAAAKRRVRARRLPLVPRELRPNGHRDFLRKCHHIRGVLASRGVSLRSANAWALIFADEGDPTFSVIDWIDAGWGDPRSVDAAIRVCGTRAEAEACMNLLGRSVPRRYSDGLVTELARAMTLRVARMSAQARRSD